MENNNGTMTYVIIALVVVIAFVGFKFWKAKQQPQLNSAPGEPVDY
ncbi:hypothetical protein LLE49_20055 [Alicyclobacillus tolerans]|nr:hypothetical protein [Alicyclobacillus tolerans]MCF8567018.1 hypothetical protein [Alicyclobacillus tolerans]